MTLRQFVTPAGSLVEVDEETAGRLPKPEYLPVEDGQPKRATRRKADAPKE